MNVLTLRNGVTAVAVAAVATFAGVTLSGGAAPALHSNAVVAADVAGATDVRGLVTSSSLVVIGTPVGSPREVALESTTFGADFYQEVAVEETLRGRPVDTITIVRYGLKEGVFAAEDHDVEGPLSPGRQVFFLSPGGTEGTWSVSGHAQGDVDFSTGKTAGSDLEGMNGQDRESLGRLIAQHPEKAHH